MQCKSIYPCDTAAITNISIENEGKLDHKRME